MDRSEYRPLFYRDSDYAPLIKSALNAGIDSLPNEGNALEEDSNVLDQAVDMLLEANQKYMDRRFQVENFIPSIKNNDIDKACRVIELAQSKISEIPPEILKSLSYYTKYFLRENNPIAEAISSLDRAIQLIERTLSANVKLGRPSDDTLHELIWDVARIFELITGERPANNFEKASGPPSLRMEDKMQFVAPGPEFIFSVVRFLESTCTRQNIETALRAKKKGDHLEKPNKN